MTTRTDGRAADALRPITVEKGLQRNPEGSILYRCGGTSVLIAVSVNEGVPDWMRNEKRGWLTADYAMHPRCGPDRQKNLGRRDRPDGRASEIQRLVGRSLRAALDLDKLGQRTIYVDCDVLDADGGTRTASITGGMIALCLALEGLRKRGLVDSGVLRSKIAAISVGLLGSVPTLDLNYVEDRDAAVDLNVVAGLDGSLVEVQGTAEGAPIPRASFDAMLDLALCSVPALVAAQDAALASAGVDVSRLLPGKR